MPAPLGLFGVRLLQRLRDQIVNLWIAVEAIIGGAGAGVGLEQRLDDGPPVVAPPVRCPSGFGDIPDASLGIVGIVEQRAVIAGLVIGAKFKLDSALLQ